MVTMPGGLDASVLLERIRTRDPAAFRQVYEQYRLDLYRYCYMALSGDDAAEDAVHETFLKLLRDPPVCESLRGLKAWLYRVACNEAAALRRRQKRLVRMDADEIPHEETPLSVLTASETTALVRRGLASITAEYRDVLLLREFGELSYAEIAEVTGSTVSAVKSAIFRARRALADAVRPMMTTERDRS